MYQKRNKQIIFCLTTSEYEELVKLWKKSAYSHLSEYIRNELLNKKQESNALSEILQFLRLLEKRKE